jgi:hypothetical protein
VRSSVLQRHLALGASVLAWVELGVSKITRKPELENWKTGKLGIRFRFRFEKSKNRIPRFRYLVFGTRFLPGYRELGFHITENPVSVPVVQNKEPGYSGSSPRFLPKTEKLDRVNTIRYNNVNVVITKL